MLFFLNQKRAINAKIDIKILTINVIKKSIKSNLFVSNIFIF
jgi:hypothetical protein